MANLRTNNLSGEQGQNAYRGSVLLESDSSSRISVTNTTGLDFGTDQFTIEFWIYLLKEPPVNKNIFARSTSASNTTGMIMWFDGNGHLEFDSIHGVSGAVHTGAAIGNHMWHHIAVTRDSSNNTRLYLNGVNKASASSDTSNIVGATNLQIASNIGADGYYNDAYISNFRMVKGTAIYSGTTDFTPPQSELTVVDGTILLCCQDSNDPTQEATDKTVAGFGNLATAGYLGTQPKVIPPFGVDAGNTFGGPIQQSTQGYMCFPTGRTEERGRGRGIFHGGYVGPSPGNSYNAQLAAVDIQSTGTFQIFGDLTQARYTTTTVGSSTRSIFAGGGAPVSPSPFASVNTMDFITIANSSNAIDFGDTTSTGYQKSAVSSSTRGVITGGKPYTPSAGDALNTLDLVTIATAGNATDFGDLTAGGRFTMPNTAMSPTRGLFAGGKFNSPSDYVNNIESITIATTGNTTDFGDLLVKGGRSSGNCSSNTRGVFSISNYPSSDSITLEFVTIASTGNATDFGDHATATTTKGALSDTIRGLFYGGFSPAITGTYQNTVDQITIATTGNAVDWGDIQLSTGTGRGAYVSGISDSHGGLS